MLGAILAIVLLGSGVPRGSTYYSTVDTIELNECPIEGTGRTQRQYIFWDHYPSVRRYHVVGWCLERDGDVVKVGDHYVATCSRSHRLKRVIRAAIYKETETLFDPEKEDKKLLPEERRRCLPSPPGIKENRIDNMGFMP